jgi:hypothetical protein
LFSEAFFLASLKKRAELVGSVKLRLTAFFLAKLKKKSKAKKKALKYM